MSAPTAQSGYGPPPKSNDDGWIPTSSSSTKSKTIYQEAGAGTLEDSWSHGSETYVTTVPYHGSTSTSKKEQKGRGDQSYYGKGSSSSKAKGHRHSSSSSSSGSGEVVSSTKSKGHHSGSDKDGRRKSQQYSSPSYKKPTPHQQQGSIFSEIGEMWKTVMDSAIAGSSHIANAYGFNSRPPPKQHKVKEEKLID